MRIDIWSDVVCPWCWIGKRRLQRAIALLGDDAPAIDIHWHPYLLDPDADDTPVPLREAYARKFDGAERTAQLLAQMQATARAEGLPFDFDRGQVRVTTLPAHRLLALAAQEGDPDAVGEALFHAHFAQGRNLADVEVLVEVGTAGGLDAARVRGLLAGDEGEAEVQARIAQAQAMGIRAVPTFVVDGRLAVQGAQPPEVLAATLRRALDAAVPPAAPGAVCGPDGCA
ncbi:DsbA family oxidoreductase [Luteimonas sp. FCS-9]|uniref:DsbA family oxidoreductase n=1 Tax=Luteimonas sp. FCS-9 TaxID=1547516 RepID=UPI00063EB604|nr:DsbA family oxidoreductase [Luteimonas sp. FCS-9]KLJ02902.1 polyketide synthase [Luteimonas sp. FCS-9]